MINEAIILAGGLGTRLKTAVPDLPKALAPVAGRPFLFYVINYLRLHGINSFIFSLGYRADLIINYLKNEFPLLDYKIVIEDDPLGTGGAIKKSLNACKQDNIIIANGDTLFKVDLQSMFSFHIQKNSECTLALKYMANFDRYGVVELNEDSRIISFREKAHYENGWINGGLYIIHKSSFHADQFPQKFSFEKEYLEDQYQNKPFYGFQSDGYFIDIGIPGDYQTAERDLSKRLDLQSIDNSWTIFLDRDGVINEEKPGNYILNPSEFIFTNRALEAINIISVSFGKVLIVSNQRGIGKSLMTIDDLQSIHNEMLKQITSSEGRIDNIYYCSEVDNNHPNRKPNIGMARQALQDFPEIDLQKSIIVGNKMSDMKFGKAAGMFTVFIRSTNPDQSFPHPDIDLAFDSLIDFALSLKR